MLVYLPCVVCPWLFFSYTTNLCSFPGITIRLYLVQYCFCALRCMNILMNNASVLNVNTVWELRFSKLSSSVSSFIEQRAPLIDPLLTCPAKHAVDSSTNQNDVLHRLNEKCKQSLCTNWFLSVVTVLESLGLFTLFLTLLIINNNNVCIYDGIWRYVLFYSIAHCTSTISFITNRKKMLLLAINSAEKLVPEINLA
jgi:hypothetical protein